MAIRVAIDGYDSLDQIGVGGMAAVYRARKVSINKTVAIKILFPYFATDESYIERFQREAKAAASIQHENIVNVIDFGESDGAFYIVMEYYDGRTLEQLMKERPGLPPEIAIQILLEVAYGLEAAHALDIVHRDIKPANVIFTNQGGIKIADFGLARKSDSMTMITQHGKVIGTPAYMSPEQAAGRPVGPASDIFSFGVVAYELLGRRKPFQGQAYSEVLDKIQTQDPPPVTIANPLIAPEFEHIVQRALAKNESDRYGSAGELIADFEAAMEKNQITRDRRRLASYAKDPDQYDTAYAEQTITQCLSRGAFFMQKGNTHLKDAVLEYRRVLFLDPNHERAQANLARLDRDPKNSARTRTPDALTRSESAATRLVPAARGAQPAPSRRRVPKWVYAVAAATLIGASAAAVWIASHPRVSGDTAKQFSVREGQAESMPVLRPESSQTMSASVAPAPVMPLTDAPDPEPRPVDGDTADAKPTHVAAAKTRNDPDDLAAPASDASTRQKAAPKSGPVRPVLAPDGTSTSTKPAVVPGSLSVYFLGGVGELWVDGKLFTRQPPFEKASIAAGAHRIACRMSGDQSGQEFRVTIRPGRETVIEYEIGGQPVVTDE